MHCIRDMHPNSRTRLGRGCSRWGHACIFCTSNPKGQTSCLASYVVVGNSLSLGSIFLTSLSNSPNPLSDTPFVAFHCRNSKVVPSFFNPFWQPGYNLWWSSNNFWNFNLSVSLSQSACTLCNACPRSLLGSYKFLPLQNYKFFPLQCKYYLLLQLQWSD